jgi:hypothetical protein
MVVGTFADWFGAPDGAAVGQWASGVCGNANCAGRNCEQVGGSGSVGGCREGGGAARMRLTRFATGGGGPLPISGCDDTRRGGCGGDARADGGGGCSGCRTARCLLELLLVAGRARTDWF